MQIANGLERYRQFIIYSLVPSADRPGKTDKFPLDYRTGFKTDLTNPLSWTDADTACTAAATYGTNYGVGFVFTETDPFWFLDIDDCLVDGAWSPLAHSLLTAFAGAAVEVSSSGRGLHIFGSGKPPPHGTRHTEHGLEFYTSKRFVALTGTGLAGSALMDCTAALQWLVTNYFPPASYAPSQWAGPVAEWRGPTDDVDLLARMLRSEGFRASLGKGASFAQLWDADPTVLATVYNGDTSAMDAALAQHLAFWTGNDCDRIQRLMLKSKLSRDKWERPDYLPRTILSATAKQHTWLHDAPPRVIVEIVAPTPEAIRAKPSSGNAFLNLQQQIDFFRGCIYVSDAHRVLVPGGVLLRPEQFRARYGGFVFPIDSANGKTTRNAWEAFTESQILEKPMADTTCFRPAITPGALIEENGRKLANTWWPVNTPRCEGDPTRFINHVAKLIPHQRDREILLAYLAACVQHLGIKFQWAPFIQGIEGNGKTLITWCVAYAIGERYVSYPRADQISAKFNYWMFEKILVGIEDIYVPWGQQEIIETLKPMITNDRQPIEPKGVDMATREVCCNFIINSNHKDGLPKSQNDRRFAPFFTAQQKPEDLRRDGITEAYLKDLHAWLQTEGGFAIVAHYLATYPIPDDINPAHRRRAPQTSSTVEAITHGRSSVEQEILEAVGQGMAGFKGGWISSTALDDLLKTLNLQRKCPRNKRTEVLYALGYVLHPGLFDGRVNAAVVPDMRKPRLFVLKDHIHRELTNPGEIAHCYSTAQAY